MVALIALAMLTIAALFHWRVTANGSTRPAWRPLDIGVVFVWVVAMYGASPIAGIELARLGIGMIADQRMGDRIPDSTAVADAGWVYLLFLLGFAASYALLRKRSCAAQAQSIARPLGRDVAIVFLVYVTVQAVVGGVRTTYGVGEGDDYLGSYAELLDLPLLVRQLLGVVQAMDFAVAVLLIVVTIAWRPRLHWLMGLFVGYLLADAFLVGGARSYAFLCGLAYVVARSLYGPKMSGVSLAATALAGLLAFVLAGALRQSRLDDEALSPLAILQGGEFTSFFFNALDLQERSADLAELGLTPALYLVDLLRLLPRQIAGELKVDPAVLYVSTFYPEFYDAGGGLAFGAIAESVLGFGAPEALVRGALLGAAYVWLRNGLNAPRISVVRGFVYVWFVVLAYQGLRDTTFSVFARFTLQVLPVIVLLWAIGFGRSRTGRLERARPVSRTTANEAAPVNASAAP